MTSVGDLQASGELHTAGRHGPKPGIQIPGTSAPLAQPSNRKSDHMSHLDDFPKRHSSHEIDAQSAHAFRAAICEYNEFTIQFDKNDYGTDFIIEAVDAGEMTNVRVHVQLKGTRSEARADGSVAVTVAKTNVNYLATPRGSIYVCYHIPTERLLVRRVDDVVREYEHRGNDWHAQKTVTVRFKETFDLSFQQSLKKYVVTSAKGERDRRLNLAVQPPETLSILKEEGIIDLPVPADPEQAIRVLDELYKCGRDQTISRSFDKFHAVLSSSDEAFLLVYMAEINLGINGMNHDETRIRKGIDALRNAVRSGQPSPGSLLFCVGNGWFALKRYKKAIDAYNSALCSLDTSTDTAAQCCKNLGTAFEKLNDPSAARSFYERALDPHNSRLKFA